MSGGTTGDLRVRRTRKLLREALVELIEERGFDRVTVGEIAGRAMVSRAAFYRNYRDKFHLVEQIFDEAMDNVSGKLGDSEEQSKLERWVAFFEHIEDYHRLYGALLGRKGSPWFAERMRHALTDMVTPHFADARSDGLAPAVLSAMFLQSIIWWLEEGRPASPRDVATRSARLAGAVIAEAGTWRG